jgi:hypothetical protein
MAAQRIATENPLTIAIPQIHDPAAMEFAINRLAEIANGDLITPHERIYYAQVALDAMGRYAADPVKYAFYDLVRIQESIVKSLDQPALAEFAAQALGNLGTARAQRMLSDVASHTGRPIEVRRAAAAAFRAAVRRQHLQLTTQEILLQYDRYNLSEHLDRETQQVLGHVLDTIEGRGAESPPPQPPHVEEPAPAS